MCIIREVATPGGMTSCDAEEVVPRRRRRRHRIGLVGGPDNVGPGHRGTPVRASSAGVHQCGEVLKAPCTTTCQISISSPARALKSARRASSEAAMKPDAAVATQLKARRGHRVDHRCRQTSYRRILHLQRERPQNLHLADTTQRSTVARSDDLCPATGSMPLLPRRPQRNGCRCSRISWVPAALAVR